MAATVGMLVIAAAPSISKPRTRIALPGSAPAGRSSGGGGGGAGLVVECSSRPQKKATAHHMKTRPKKTQPWDVKRKGPTFYPPLPALPPDWTLVTDDQQQQQQQQQQEEEGGAAPESSSASG